MAMGEGRRAQRGHGCARGGGLAWGGVVGVRIERGAPGPLVRRPPPCPHRLPSQFARPENDNY